MKLRQTLTFAGVGAALVCLAMVAVLVVTIGEVDESRRGLREMRDVDDALHRVSSELIGFGLEGLGSHDISSLMGACEKLEEVVSASGRVPEDFHAEWGRYGEALEEFCYRAGHGKDVDSDVSEPELREAILSGMAGMRRRVDDLTREAEHRMTLAQERVVLFASVLLGLVVVLIAGLLVRVARRVLAPARNLRRAMQDMDEGTWPDEVPVPLDDELGELTATFNSMAVGRRETEEELRAIKSELEVRVERRTRALAEANEALGVEVEERRRAEELLRASEERFRGIFEESPNGIALVGPDGTMVTANGALGEILGVPAVELAGRALSTLVAGEEDQSLIGQAREAFADGAPSFTAEVGVLRPDGERRLIHLVAAPVLVREADGGCGLLMADDITDRKRAEELLLESERFAATGRMAARVAHEINNPLAAIKNAFRLVRTAVPGDHEFYKYVHSIDTEIDRVARIVRQMYEVYRPPVQSAADFCAAEAVRDIVELMRAGSDASGAPEIRLDVEDARAQVHLQEGPLRQVLYNLIRNAQDHSPEATPVEVRARTSEHELEVWVSDHGEGIPPEHAGRIYEPFFTTKEGREGTGLGLGLSITLRAVEALGGELSHESTVGEGSTFHVRLPLRSASLAPTS